MAEYFILDDSGKEISSMESFLQFFEGFFDLWKGKDELVSIVILSHLIIEHYMNKYIQKKNPNLGDIEDNRISFSQKIKLLNPKDKNIKKIIAPLQAINSVRNKYVMICFTKSKTGI